jgi:hypothetical protein
MNGTGKAILRCSSMFTFHVCATNKFSAK